jgi:hypothetical protein
VRDEENCLTLFVPFFLAPLERFVDSRWGAEPQGHQQVLSLSMCMYYLLGAVVEFYK